MSSRFIVLPLLLSLCAGCNYVKSRSPIAPSQLTTESRPTADPTTHAAYPSNGPELVAFVSGQYPERLAPHVGHGERVRNMEFLRDRVIEAGLCGGMDLAWNLKRGVGPRSADAVAWRHDGVIDVVDIGIAYDDDGIALKLDWQIVHGPAGWDEFPKPECR